MYTKEELIRLRNSGNYPIVNLKIFDSINKIKLSDKVLDNLKWTEELYIERIETINSLDELNDEIYNTNNYLEGIKSVEIKENQESEKENIFAMNIFGRYCKTNSIDYLLEHDFNKETFIKAHQILLDGTSSQEYAEKAYRDNNDTYISQKNPDGTITPYYFALDYKDIPEAIDRIVELYTTNDDTNIFQKGIIIHGLVAALQMFNDGNTRMGRILQYLKIKDSTENVCNKKLEKPYLYGSLNYKDVSNYRELMSSLAINPDNEIWNNWTKFNLNTLQERMFMEERELESIKIKAKTRPNIK